MYVEMTRHEELVSTVWDFYKEVHGFRPRHLNLNAMTEEQLDAEMVSLEAQGKVEAARRDEAEKTAAVNFEKLMTNTIANGAGDRATALRWLHTAEGTDNGDNEYLCYVYGLPYGYFK